MKKLMACLIAVLSISAAQAQDIQTIINSIYKLEDTVRMSTRRVERRPRLAQDINEIIQDAIAKVELKLNERGNGGRAIDMQLVNVTVNACSNLGTYSSRESCFKNYLAQTRGILGSVYFGCSAISDSAQQSSECYNRGLRAIQAGKVDIESISLAACGNLGTYSSRKTCYDAMFVESYSLGAVVLAGACGSIESAQQSSDCYSKGLNTLSSNSATKTLILNACSNLGTYSSRATCFVGGVDAAEANGENLKRYLRGCYNMSSDQQSSECFARGLRSL